MKDCKEVFTDIYAKKVWGEGSGGGSDPMQAKPYCDFISDLLKDGRGMVLDIGCGDLRIHRQIRWGMWDYYGIDACDVDSTGIGRNGGSVELHGNGAIRHNFYGSFDALTDELPAADLVLCKEVLQHLSNQQVELLLKRTDHYPRRLFTSITGEGTNVDIETGQTRPVDIMLPPFSRPARNVLTYGDGNYVIQEL